MTSPPSRRARPGLRAAVRAPVGVAVAIGLALTPAMAAAQPTDRPPAAGVGTAGSGTAGSGTAAGGTAAGGDEAEPSPAEVQAQQQRVAGLRAQVERQAADVSDARAALQANARLAAQALEASATAVRQLQADQQREQLLADRLTTAQQQLAEQRKELGRWAREAYQTGAELTAAPAVTVMLTTDDTADLGTNLTVLRRLGHEHGRTVEALGAARQVAERAADAAADATAASARQAVEATDARREADAAVAQQRRMLGRADDDLDEAQGRLSAAEQHQRDLRARAAQAAAQLAATGRNGVTGAVGDCAGGDDIARYGNGLIPIEALCALTADPGQHLRADAAYAFDRLSADYTRQFGTEPCITDSYRSYAQQVDVRARKPGLAAVPGTSNHGWGTALDLCGGIESFTSATHRWMVLNAPLYGWFHPAWAEPQGSKPEPWHWEYAS